MNEESAKRRAFKITEQDIEHVALKSDEIEERAKRVKGLGSFWDDVKLCLELVKDYWSGNYKEIPYWAIAALVFALLYLINPVDIIPDFIPFIGQLDDAAVVVIALKLVKKELDRYVEWKARYKTV